MKMPWNRITFFQDGPTEWPGGWLRPYAQSGARRWLRAINAGPVTHRRPVGHISYMAHLARNTLRKVIHAAAITALLAGAASAQLPLPGLNLSGDEPSLTPQEEEKRKATEDAYKSALKKIPDKQKSADPWENIRPNSSTASKTKQGEH